VQWIASGFLFVRGNSIIHRMDPRTRLFLAITLFVISIIAGSITELVALIAVTYGITFVARIAKRFSRTMAYALIFAGITFVLNYFAFPHFPNPLHYAIVVSVRLFAVIASISIFFLSTTPDELEQVMKWFRFPSDFVMVFVIAVRFVPVLLLDAMQIMDAQRSRGLEFEKGNILRRLRNTIPILVPLIAVAVNRSLDLAEAMDSRAYGALPKPTSLYNLKMRAPDFLALASILIASTIGIYSAFFVTLF
jgi:energy-coupling factor transport system permease protein